MKTQISNDLHLVINTTPWCVDCKANMSAWLHRIAHFITLKTPSNCLLYMFIWSLLFIAGALSGTTDPTRFPSPTSSLKTLLSHAFDCHMAHSNHEPVLITTEFKPANRILGGNSLPHQPGGEKNKQKKHTRSPDCARRHLARKTQRILNNENTIYWRLKRTKSIIINVTYYCGDFCVSLRYPLEKKTVEQLPGAWLFSQTRWHERAHCTDDSRFLSWIFFSNSFHSRDVLPFQEMKKNLLLSIWPLIPTRAS